MPLTAIVESVSRMLNGPILQARGWHHILPGKSVRSGMVCFGEYWGADDLGHGRLLVAGGADHLDDLSIVKGLIYLSDKRPLFDLKLKVGNLSKGGLTEAVLCISV